ncbi:unnamed protein product [Prunus armeniaca]
MKIVLSCADGSGEDYKLLPSGPASLPDEQVPISHNDDNVYWKELLMIVYVWVAFLIVQIVKVPFAVSVTLFEAKFLCKGPGCGIVAGMMGSLLGLGGGFFMGPLQKILSRNPWQGKITEEVWIQNSLIIGFDPKSSTAISNLDRIKELYAILLVMQPMIMLGISIGVAFNVMFADWMEDNYEATVNHESNESDKLSLLPFPSRLGYFSPRSVNQGSC